MGGPFDGLHRRLAHEQRPTSDTCCGRSVEKGDHFIFLCHPFTTQIVSKEFVEEVVRLYGIPRSIVTDRGCIFISIFWKELFVLQGSQLKASSAYHPQTDSQTEVTNCTLEQYLCCFCHEEQSKCMEL